jgi:pimeloyl-ACP methyl ester carboxylesterase
MKMNIWVAIALIAVITFIIALHPRPGISIPSDARAGDLTLETCEYKTKTRTYRAECGTLIVPENRLNPTSRLLALPVKRIHTESDSPREPIVYLGGGPGLSNIRFDPSDELLAEHDFILVGYRGVDGSSLLDCPEYAKATLGNGRDIFSDESLTMMTEAIRSCRARLEASGVDLSGYMIPAVVEDMEAARAALGYERVNLLSASYGTRVAQVYSHLYPDKLKRSVMIGVNPPGRFVWEPGMVDAQIEQYSRLWAADESAHPRSENLAETMRKVSHNMPRRWLFFPIDAGKVNAVAFMLFFNRNTSALVFDAYVAAEHGDVSGLALMSMAYDFVVPKSFVWGDFFAKAVVDMDFDRNYVTDMRAPDSIIGSPISLLTWAPLSQAWVQDKLPFELGRIQPTDVETLLISGSMDFSTPAEYAHHELLPLLKNGRQVILSEVGHVGDIWSVQPAATLRLLTSFYAAGTVDESSVTYAPMDFNVKFGFPLIAKGLLAICTLLVIGFILWLQRMILVR